MIERLWYWSARLHRMGLTPLAWLIKLAIFVAVNAVLPYEIDVPRDVRLWHRGMGVVIHPNTVIGRRVTIGHGALITAGSQEPGSPRCTTLEDDVVVGAGALLRCKRGGMLRVGAGAVVGAHAVVIRDVPSGAKVLPVVSEVRVSGSQPDL